MSDWGPWARILVRHSARAFESQARIDTEWRALNFIAAPDYGAASRQHDALIDILRSAAPVHAIDSTSPGLSLDAIYVRDASIVTPRGAILCTGGARESRGSRRALPRAD